MAVAGLARRPDEQRRRALARAVGRPPSVLLGRVPRERHEHYSPDGTLTGFTVIIRESEWLDSDLAQMEELARVEGESCPGCGWHDAVIHDDDNTFGPKDRHCPICAAKTQYERLLHKGDEQEREAKKDSPPTTPHAADGRWTQMALLTPEEIEKRRGGGSGDKG